MHDNVLTSIQNLAQSSILYREKLKRDYIVYQASAGQREDVSHPFRPSFPKTFYSKWTVMKMLFNVWKLMPPNKHDSVKCLCQLPRMMSVIQQGLSQRSHSPCWSEITYSTLPTPISLREDAHSMRMRKKNGFGEITKGQVLGKPWPVRSQTDSRIVFPTFPSHNQDSHLVFIWNVAEGKKANLWRMGRRTVISSWGQGEDGHSHLGICMKTGLFYYSPGIGGQSVFGYTLAWDSTRSLLMEAWSWGEGERGIDRRISVQDSWDVHFMLRVYFGLIRWQGLLTSREVYCKWLGCCQALVKCLPAPISPYLHSDQRITKVMAPG